MSSKFLLTHLQHCRILEISEGIYVVQPITEQITAGNSGIIAMGDVALIFDTMLTSDAARELYEAAEELTGTPVKLVINSHHHPDHVGGNSVFPQTVDIISTATTRRLMEIHLSRQLTEQLSSLGLTHQEHHDIRLPNVTFEQTLHIYGTQRRVEIITYGGGHTESDTILHLPDDRIVFMGDLLTTHNHPYLADGDPGELPRILDIISLLNPQHIVPGHGPLSSLADVQTMQSYLAMLTETALTELAFQYEDEDELEHKVASFQIPAVYMAWERSEYFKANLRFFYQRVMNAYAD